MRFSESCSATLGIACEQGPLPRSRWLERVHPDDRAALVAAMDRCVNARGECSRIGYRIADQDGKDIPVEEYAEALARDDDGTGQCVRSVLRIASGDPRP
jgi:hypothetical protein